MLRAADLRVAFDGATALDVAELRLRAGRITVVLGPNGSGKTTLLRALAGLVGNATVELDGGRLSPRDVSYAFQRPVLLRGTVRHNLELALKLRAPSSEQCKRRLDDVVAALELEPLLERPSQTLSGGEAQRVNLARALALAGAVTLLDEPLTGLDEDTRARMTAQLPELLEGATRRGLVVLVTHSLQEAQRLADDLLLLVSGRVRAQGPLLEVMTAPPDEASSRLLGYTVHRSDGAAFAVAPGGWRLDGGDPEETLTVKRVVDLPGVRRVIGVVAGSLAEVALPDGASPPKIGETLGVHSGERARVELPATDD